MKICETIFWFLFILCLFLNSYLQSFIIYQTIRNVVIGCVTCSGHNQDRNTRAWILPFWSKTDMDSLKQNLWLAPDQKMVGTKKGCKWSKNQFGIIKFFGLFFVKKQHYLLFPKITYDILFSTKLDTNWVQTIVE